MISAPMKVTLVDSMGSDLSVVNAARVSFDKESELVSTTPDGVERVNGSVYDMPLLLAEMGMEQWNLKTTFGLSKSDKGLISYLAKHQHTSPFNHCFATFRVKAPIFVARQLVKHKFLPWNEISRRYVNSAPEFYIPETFRGKAENVKQGSTEEAHEHSEVFKSITTTSVVLALSRYNALITEGVCPEQARMVLPLNTHTEWIWSGSLGAFADMCRLRLDSHAQAETREIAQRVSEEMLKLYPVSWDALMNIGKTK